MPQPTLQVVWRPEDAAEVFQRAATVRAGRCPAALSGAGESYPCDNLTPHHVTHTSAALRARWVDEAAL